VDQNNERPKQARLRPVEPGGESVSVAERQQQSLAAWQRRRCGQQRIAQGLKIGPDPRKALPERPNCNVSRKRAHKVDLWRLAIGASGGPAHA